MIIPYTFLKTQSIDELLQEDWQLGKKLRHQLRMDQAFTHHDEPVPFHELVHQGETVHITLQAQSSYALTHVEHERLYEDEHLLVVWKPAFLKVHPNEVGEHDTLMNHVQAMTAPHPYVEHVHRLDYETAGLVLIAKHPIAKNLLDRMFERGEVERFYEAVVEGRLLKKRGTIRQAIGRDRHHQTKRHTSETGKASRTTYEAIEVTQHYSIVRVQLHTGRTHQIRVHFSSIGHPIVGDEMYGGEKQDEPYALVANELNFIHPITKEKISIKKELSH